MSKYYNESADIFHSSLAVTIIETKKKELYMDHELMN
jgi:hypothetical protein